MGLKELLGDELFGKITEALKGKGKDGKDAELLVNEGNYIPKEKFDALNTEKKTYKDQVDKLNGDLETLKKSAGDNEGLKKQIETLQGENKNLGDKVKETALEAAVKIGLVGAKAKAQYIDLILPKVDKSKLILDGDKITGLDEQVKTLQETFKDLFDVQDGGTGNVGDPPNYGKGFSFEGIGKKLAEQQVEANKGQAESPYFK